MSHSSVSGGKEARVESDALTVACRYERAERGRGDGWENSMAIMSQREYRNTLIDNCGIRNQFLILTVFMQCIGQKTV